MSETEKTEEDNNDEDDLKEDETLGNEEETITDLVVPNYLQESVPSGKVDQVMWYAYRGKTRKELEKPPYGFKTGTIRVAFNKLEGLEPTWSETKKVAEPPPNGKTGAEIVDASKKSPQIFAKGSPPEAIIESITIPMVDGQHQGFEQGMKFGMSQLVLAVRIMQELSAIGLQQVKPLIDMTRSVREGEQAAFKGGADEAAYKSAQAMGATILPMISELQTSIDKANRPSDADPVKGMMVRTMEPLMNTMMKRLMPGTETADPSGWTRKSE